MNDCHFLTHFLTLSNTWFSGFDPVNWMLSYGVNSFPNLTRSETHAEWPLTLTLPGKEIKASQVVDLMKKSFVPMELWVFQFPRRTLSAFEIIRVVCGLILKLNLVNRVILVNLKKIFFGFFLNRVYPGHLILWFQF